MTSLPPRPRTPYRPPNVGLIGRKRTGKDTAADYLAATYGYSKDAFANPLRDLALAVDPIVAGAYIAPGGHRLTEVHYSEALDVFGYEEAKDRFPEVRRFLQNLGVGVRDVLGESTWVDALARRVRSASGPVVVTDVRFPNEVDVLKDLGFVLVRLTREAAPRDDSHVSETLVDSLDSDFDFPNDGSLEDLHVFLDVLLREVSS